MLRPLLASLLLLALAAPASAETAPDQYEQIYLTQPEAIAVAIPGATAVVPHPITPTAAEIKRVQRRLGRKLEEDRYTFFEGQKGGKTAGWAVVLEEKGKYYPITFIVGLTPGGEVADVAVMVYREKRGDAVKRRRFLDQFVGLDKQDPIMVNRDITHLTGSTVSSWAIAAGVKKAVALFDVLRPRLERRP